jgi:hypothetical protein
MDPTTVLVPPIHYSPSKRPPQGGTICLPVSLSHYASCRTSGGIRAGSYGFAWLWCMNRGNANEINVLRFSALNRKT